MIDTEESVHYLNNLPVSDSEASHYNADMMLVAYLRSIGETQIAMAWERASERIGFRYE